MRDDAQAGIERPVKFGSLSAVPTVIVALSIIFIGVHEFFYPGVAAAGPGFRFWTGAMAMGILMVIPILNGLVVLKQAD